MNAQQKINRLQPLLEQAQTLYTGTRHDAEFVVWRERLTETFKLLFGVDSEHARRVSVLDFTVPWNAGAGHSYPSTLRRAAAFKHDLDLVVNLLKKYINELQLELSESVELSPLAHLHPAVQAAAGSLFDTNHYPHAIQAACTALEKAIQHKSGQSASVTGTALIGRAFPKDNPLLTLSADQGEREGYGFLYRGLLQAVRNHYAHNLTEILAPRALEWLSFISALFHKLDEAQPTPAPPQL